MTTLDGAVDLARDRELVERCQAGDEGSFAELYTRYHRRLLRFCLRRLHSNDDAEEAVQESFTRAWRALPTFGGDRRFYPWLTVIAGNVCTDVLRRRARVVPMEEMPVGPVQLDVDDVDADLMRQADLALATAAFANLSDRHQRVLRLRESTEWSAQKIAEVEGVAVPAVDTLLWRAREAFRREFAVLSDAGGLAGFLGLCIATLRRGVGRVWLRVAAHTPAPLRGPGALAATLALTGAAIAGGGVALVGSGPPAHRVTGIPASTTSASSSSPSSPSSGPGTGSAGAGSGLPTTNAPGSSTGGQLAGVGTPVSGSSLPGGAGATGLAGVLSGGATPVSGSVGGVVGAVTGVQSGTPSSGTTTTGLANPLPAATTGTASPGSGVTSGL